MNDTDQTTLPAHIFLMGDPSPIVSTLGVDEVLARVHDAAIADESGIAFVTLPMRRGDAKVRPAAIAAVLPADDEDE